MQEVRERVRARHPRRLPAHLLPPPLKERGDEGRRVGLVFPAGAARLPNVRGARRRRFLLVLGGLVRGGDVRDSRDLGLALAVHGRDERHGSLYLLERHDDLLLLVEEICVGARHLPQDMLHQRGLQRVVRRAHQRLRLPLQFLVKDAVVLRGEVQFLSEASAQRHLSQRSAKRTNLRTCHPPLTSSRHLALSPPVDQFHT
mmetsp:Transcript_18300/g.41184  ORF Transcript_18300/g.41184 Transcript_18300/m.41184 type:complete len:201 (+) Transcript_18300:1340-1942(+)